MAVRNAIAGCAGVLALMAGSAAGAQVDPFGALYGQPVQPQPQARGGGAHQGASGRNGVVVGVLSVSGAVGRSYAGSQEKGTVSLAEVARLPKTVQPFAVTLDGTSTKYLRNRPRIAVPAYALGLQRDSSISASAAGQRSDITPRRTTITSHLSGVSDQLASQLSQEAYDDLVAKLDQALASFKANFLAQEHRMQVKEAAGQPMQAGVESQETVTRVVPTGSGS